MSLIDGFFRGLALDPERLPPPVGPRSPDRAAWAFLGAVVGRALRNKLLQWALPSMAPKQTRVVDEGAVEIFVDGRWIPLPSKRRG